MRVISTCPLPVASWLWQSHPSAWVLTVVCRATFLLKPVESVLAPDQEDPIEHDDHWDDDAGRSLRVASDLAPLKPRADVTLVGNAFAPGGAKVRSLVARLLVGEIDKSIEVCCDRAFDQEGALREGPHFARMPLLYERAAGGPDTTNPVGVRAVPNAYGRIALPNLQPPGIHVTSPDEYIEPVGFGPIAPGWPSRREKLGRLAGLGVPVDGRRQPLPEGLDPAFFNHAPRDQQVAELREDERIILENLHPEHPRLVTSLPGVRPRAVVERRGSAQPVPLACDTLWIDTDRALCTLTWRAQVPLEGPDEDGLVVFSFEPPGRIVSASDPRGIQLRSVEDPSETLPTPGKAQLQATGSASETLIPRGRAEAPSRTPTRVLPFAQAPAPASALPFAPAPSTGRGSDRGTAAGGLPFVGAPTVGAPTVPVVPPARPSQPALPIPPPPARPSQPSLPVPPPIAPPAAATPWAVPEAQPGASAPMTVGQLSAQSAPEPAPAPVVDEATRPSPKAEPKKEPEPRRAIQLVWFDPECLPRVRRKAAYQPLFDALEERPIDSDLDDPSSARDPAAVEDRRDVFEVLARGEAAEEAKLNEALDRALRDDGKFVPPFLLVAGEVRLPFDELAALKATLSVASPFASGDEALKGAIADARELLRTADLMCPPGVYEGFTTRVQEAFRKTRRTTVPPGYLDEQVERTLVERRSYQRREVFGAPHVRALLQLGPVVPAGPPPKPWPLYLPEPAARSLPLFARFPARLLVEARLQEDQYEAHAFALRASALARVSTMPEKVAKS